MHRLVGRLTNLIADESSAGAFSGETSRKLMGSERLNTNNTLYFGLSSLLANEIRSKARKINV